MIPKLVSLDYLEFKRIVQTVEIEVKLFVPVRYYVVNCFFEWTRLYRKYPSFVGLGGLILN